MPAKLPDGVADAAFCAEAVVLALCTVPVVPALFVVFIALVVLAELDSLVFWNLMLSLPSVELSACMSVLWFD